MNYSLVVTSINPASKTNYQFKCFRAWKRAGYTIKTFNSQREAQALQDQGLSRDDIEIIADGDTMSAYSGKHNPRIYPILSSVSASNAPNIILVNSDIYPAHGKDVGDFLAQHAGMAAFTRLNCIDVRLLKPNDAAFYRGGLDIFFFSADEMRRLLAYISKESAADAMAFGIPGWDFYLAFKMMKILPDTLIADGPIFAHEEHANTYSDIAYFNHFLPMMSDLVPAAAAYSMEDAAQRFADTIVEHCLKNRRFSDRLRTAFYAVPQQSSLSKRATELLSIANALLCENEGYRLFAKDLAHIFMERQIEKLLWETALPRSEGCHPGVSSSNVVMIYLILAVIVMKYEHGQEISMSTPASAAHIEMMNLIMTQRPEQDRFGHILDVFCSDLINHAVFNRHTFAYILSHASTKHSMGLAEALLKVVKGQA